MTHDAENRLTAISEGGVTATYVYDADGNRVKETIAGVTRVFVGNHYEVDNGVVKKYYYAGATRMVERCALQNESMILIQLILEIQYADPLDSVSILPCPSQPHRARVRERACVALARRRHSCARKSDCRSHWNTRWSGVGVTSNVSASGKNG